MGMQACDCVVVQVLQKSCTIDEHQATYYRTNMSRRGFHLIIW